MLIINKKIISYFILFLICMQSLGFALPGNIFIAFFMPVTLFFLCYHFLSDKYLINHFIFLCKYTPFLYLFLFYIWSIFTIVISIIKGFFVFSGFLTGFVGGLTFSVLLTFFTTYIILKKNYLDLKDIIKFLTIFYFFIFILGLIQYIGNKLDIDLITNFVSFFNNKRSIFRGQDASLFLLKHRIQSIFDEPGAFGEYIYSQLPIIYSISLSKYKIFYNKFENIFIKRMLIPLAIINLVLTLSPISLIFTFIVTIIYFYKFIIKSVKKYYLLIIITFFLSLGVIFLIPQFINLEETYIKRIIVSMPNLFHIDTLIVVEPSLATRIINYIILTKIGLTNFIFGVGYGSISNIFIDSLKQTSLPLTQELIEKIYIGKASPASAIFYRIFSETGVPGISLILIFYYKLLYKLRVIKIKGANIIKNFHYGLFISLLFQSTLLLFYGGSIHNTYNIILYAIAIFIISNKTMNVNKI